LFNLGARCGWWPRPRSDRFIPMKETRYPLYRRLGGPHGRSGGTRKISPPLGFDIYIYIHTHTMAVPWFRQLVACLSMRRPRFNLGSVCLGFVVHGGSWTLLRPSTAVFLYQCHSTSAPYQSLSTHFSYQSDR